MLAYLCAKTIRDTLNTSLKDCVNSIQKIAFGVSGGTTHTAIGLVEAYPLKFLNASLKPTALCPISPPKAKPGTKGIVSALLGWRYVKDLGVLTDSPQAASDVGIVYRSWGLFDGGKFYGPNFTFTEYMRVSNVVSGTLVHYLLATFLIGLYLRPLRWLMRKAAYAQGSGPDREEAKKNVFSYKTVATADDSSGRRAFATYFYRGAGYYMTGITLTEAALVLSRGGDCLGKRLGGMITTATLEMEYVERLQKAGIKLEWGMLG
jgi:hypothetical protein